MKHRLAEMSDIDRIMEIVSDAQLFLRESGVDQWQDGYPTCEIFAEDIAKGGCYVFTIDGIIAGVISVLFDKEDSYDIVEDGAWLTPDRLYAVCHRSAVSAKYRGRGIADEMISYSENIALEHGAKSVRADTHYGNKAMRSLLEKHGYTHCGTIRLNREMTETNIRACYEKIL